MNIDETKFVARDRMNDRLVRQVRYTGPALYVAGGDPVNAPTELGMGEVYAVLGNIGNNGGTVSTAILVPFFDYVTQKIMWFVPNTGAQASGDLSGFVGTLTFFGKG